MSAMEETKGPLAQSVDEADENCCASPEQLAHQLWNEWNLTAPVNPVILTEAYQIPVFESRLKAGVMGALIKKGDQYSIYVDKGADLPQKRFTIAHELGHYLMHQQGAPPMGAIMDYRDTLSEKRDRKREEEANQFAAALLMNRQMVKAMQDQTQSLPRIAEFFGVPLETVKYRLETIGNS